MVEAPDEQPSDVLRTPRRTVIAVDAMGGDHAPGEVVAGAVAAALQHGINVVLTGRSAQLRTLLAEQRASAHRLSRRGTPANGRTLNDLVSVAPAEEWIGMDEGALASWLRPRSSLAIACQMVRRQQAHAVVSAGSTAAIVATARLRLRLLPSVARPGLAVVLPTRPKPTIMVDAGAIADPKPEMLLQFAQLGVAYAQVGFGIAEPTVGLLSIGVEPGKGNKTTRRAYELLTGIPPHGGMPIRFAGNVEGNDLLRGRVDVVVTDGFTGNVALKATEGAAAFAAAQLGAALHGSAMARFGSVFQRSALREATRLVDSESYGGAALLGLEGTVVIAHGASTAKGVASACRLAAELAQGQISEKIRERLGPARGSHFLRRTERGRATPPAGPAATPGPAIPEPARSPSGKAESPGQTRRR